MSFGKSFTYIFEDPQWFDKLWKPVLCMLIPVIGPLVFQGYIMDVIKNVANGDPRPLHEMDFGENLTMGFRNFVVQLVYSLPLIVLSWLIVIPSMLSVGAMADEKLSLVMAVPALLSQLGLSLFSMVLSAVFYLVFPIICAHVAVKGTIKSGFEFREIFNLAKKNFAAWLMVLAGNLIAGFIGPIGVIVFFAGMFVTMAYSMLMVAHLSGQAYRASQPTVVYPSYPNYPG